MMRSTWILAARPKTLVAGICPVAMGTALAARDQHFHLGAALAALVGALSIQIGTNFANDYFDHVQGADTMQRKGPTRAVQAGLVTPKMMLRATLYAFLVTGLICVYLVMRAGWPLAVLGGISVACGIGYTATRFSLAYLGLGDLFVLVFFGPVAVGGTYYVQALSWSPMAALAGVAPGLISVAILVVNNLRDINEDALAEKRTLAVRFGAGWARWQHLGCLLLAAAVPLLLWVRADWSAGVLWASLVALLGLSVSRRLWLHEGRALNPMLGQTAGVLLLYTVVFSIVAVWP